MIINGQKCGKYVGSYLFNEIQRDWRHVAKPFYIDYFHLCEMVMLTYKLSNIYIYVLNFEFLLATLALIIVHSKKTEWMYSVQKRNTEMLDNVWNRAEPKYIYTPYPTLL